MKFYMNRHIIYVCMLILVGFVCGCSETSRMNGIRFNRINEAVRMNTAELKKVNDDDTFSNSEQVFDVSVELDSMQSNGQTDSLACVLINTYIVNTLLGVHTVHAVSDAISVYIAEKRAEFQSDEYSITCYDHITGVADYGLEGIINYTFTEDYFGGGAHPTQMVTIKRFNAQTGTPIELWDVFADSCATSLKHILTDKLMQQKDVKTMDELRELGYLEMVDMFVPTNFLMKRDSLSFFFNQYDIAPYALGQTILTFSYEELKPYMK